MKAFFFKILIFLVPIIAVAQNSAKPKATPATQLPKKTLADQLGLPKESPVAQQSGNIELRSDPLALPSNSAAGRTENMPPAPTSGSLKIETEARVGEILGNDSPLIETKEISGWERGSHSRIPNSSMQRYFFIEPGYVDSKWRQFTARLDRGSLSLRMGFGRKYSDLFESEIGYFLIRGLQKTNTPTPVYAETFNAAGRFSFFDGPMFLTTGLGLHLGAYKVWSLAAESEHNVTYTKHAGGAVFGAEPQIGMRMAFSHHFRTDLNISYLAFVDAPEFKMGGWGASLRLSWFFPTRN